MFPFDDAIMMLRQIIASTSQGCHDVPDYWPLDYLLGSLFHWGRMTHLCVINLTITDLDNGLSPGRHRVIIWTSAGIMLIGLLGANFSEILIGLNCICPLIWCNFWFALFVLFLVFFSVTVLSIEMNITALCILIAVSIMRCTTPRDGWILWILYIWLLLVRRVNTGCWDL